MKTEHRKVLMLFAMQQGCFGAEEGRRDAQGSECLPDLLLLGSFRGKLFS